MKTSINDTKYGIITSNKFNKQLKKIIRMEFLVPEMKMKFIRSMPKCKDGN